MKKRWLLGGALAAALALSACAAKKDDSAKDESGKEKVTVGVLQQMKHDSLDAAYKGFVAGLAEEGYKDGDNLTIDYQVGTGAQDTLKSMSEKLVKEKPNLLFGIATGATSTLVNETTEIPIIFTAVTDPVDAKLVASMDKPGGNVTGTTDSSPDLIKQQIALLLSIVPDAKTIGFAYDAGEKNSKIQVDLAIKELEKAGVKAKILTANSTNDVQSVITSLAKSVDGIYIPTDNTFATAAPTVGEVAKEQKVPVVTGSTEQVENGGLATYGIDYELLGKQTGQLAAKILKGTAKPTDTPVEYSKDLKLVVNEDMAKALGIDPSSIKAPQ